jgi:elongation factor G
MKTYTSQDVRNVVVVGAQGDGKTSLVEALLYNSGVTTRLGRIEDGNTVADHADEEVARKISVNMSLAFFEHNGRKINLLVTPGYADFACETVVGLAVADAALLVVSADTGVTPAVESVWESLREKQLPTLIFVNKMDKDGIDFPSVVRALKERLGKQIVDVSAPDRAGSAFSAVVSLFDDKVREEDRAFRESMIEDISSGDDVLTEEYLEGKTIAGDELRQTLKKEISAGAAFPLLCGSATRNIGIGELADFMADYLPAPAVDAREKHPAAFVFKTVSEPGTGHLNMVKVLSGTLESGKDIYNFTRRAKERIGQICFVCGKKKTETPAVSAGDIAALLKLKDTRTNDVLGDEKGAVPQKSIDFPPNIYDRSIAVHSPADEEKLGTAMAAITLENPGIRHYFNPGTREMILSGRGSLQLEIVAQKIFSRYGIAVDLALPRIPYKETIRGKAEAQGKYKRQSGGRGQYGDCWIKVEPLERGKGFEFIDKIVGGAIPRNYIPAVEKGVREAMETGVIAGYPVADIRVTLYDGSYHDVDSSDMAFKIAGAMALRKAMAEARPVILEPLMNVEVVIPDEYMGTVMGDLNSRRGRVLGIDSSGKREIIRAQVPLAYLFEYATDLRSLTKGSGSFTIKLSHYEETIPDRAKILVDDYQRERMPAV